VAMREKMAVQNENSDLCPSCPNLDKPYDDKERTPDTVDDESFSDDSQPIVLHQVNTLLCQVSNKEAQYISENDEDSIEDKKERILASDSFDINRCYPLSFETSEPIQILALRLECELFPMRQLVSRLMAHPIYNRRGIFNHPVDHVALNLVDYASIITKPRDLGTIKAKLHAIAYRKRKEVADDIRLVFTNAMLYNPSNNLVHIAAKNLLQTFEEAYQVILATSYSSESNQLIKSNPNSYQKVSSLDSLREFVSESCDSTISTPFVDFATPGESLHCNNESCKSNQPLREVTAQDPAISINSLPVEGRLGLRGSSLCVADLNASPAQSERMFKRAMNVAAKNAKHSCLSCLGRRCKICDQGCLSQEPALLICTGSNCMGAKIRKGAVYYIAKDGSRQFCQRCYTNLQAVLPHTTDQINSFGSSVRFKRDLLKRKNEEEVVESWLTCKVCKSGIHKICSMFNEYVDCEEDFKCYCCVSMTIDNLPSIDSCGKLSGCDVYTFLSGFDAPVRLDAVTNVPSPWSADSIPVTKISSFIEEKVRDCISKRSAPNVEKTIFIRVVSDCMKNFKVPEVVRSHFRMQSKNNLGDGVIPPVVVHYKSKAITLFQKLDGADVCIFCMYVHEYDCEDEFDDGKDGAQNKRVYIAYLDSVEHFRPRSCRTDVFREILNAYLATARARGYETAHIWACPPSRGNSFIFWNHPASQRTPTKDRLISWYHGALKRCIECGVVTDVQSLFESSFPLQIRQYSNDALIALDPENTIILEDGVIDGRMVCPPLLDGDFWIEEAVRLQATSILRYIKGKPKDQDNLDICCPALQISTLIRDRVMTAPAAAPFLLPVNAASMQLHDYHQVITKPMDLGTVYSKCMLGEYISLKDVVDDVELVFSNAMQYNPQGHTVHQMAIEVREIFFKELNNIVENWCLKWKGNGYESDNAWTQLAFLSMNLDYNMERQLFYSSPECSSRSGINLAQSHLVNFENSLGSQHYNIGRYETSIPSNINNSSSSELLTSPKNPLNNQSSKKLKSTLHPNFDDGKIELLSGGEEAIQQKMIGHDIWIADKKCAGSSTAAQNGKKKNSLKRHRSSDSSTSGDNSFKRRRQSWLGEEVALSVRKMRTSFFSCSLLPNKIMTSAAESKERSFNEYIRSYHASLIEDKPVNPTRVADARHAFLEFSQFRNLEFDTLRRAKYSTYILLYHIHNDDAPGLIPICTSCEKFIQEIRWHRIRRIEDRHHSGRVPPSLRLSRNADSTGMMNVDINSHHGEELCSTCYEMRTAKEEFIPLPVSFKV
jgi:hypothetical protein